MGLSAGYARRTQTEVESQLATLAVQLQGDRDPLAIDWKAGAGQALCWALGELDAGPVSRRVRPATTMALGDELFAAAQAVRRAMRPLDESFTKGVHAALRWLLTTDGRTLELGPPRTG